MGNKTSIHKYSFNKLSGLSKLMKYEFSLPITKKNIDSGPIHFSGKPDPKFLSTTVTVIEKFILTGSAGYFNKIYKISPRCPKAIDTLNSLNNSLKNIYSAYRNYDDDLFLAIKFLDDETILNAYKLIAYIEKSNKGKGSGFMPGITLDYVDLFGIKAAVERKICFKCIISPPENIVPTLDTHIFQSENIEIYKNCEKLRLEDLPIFTRKSAPFYQTITKGNIGELKTLRRELYSGDFIVPLIKKIILERSIDYSISSHGIMIYNSLTGEITLLRPYCIPPTILIILNNFTKIVEHNYPAKKYNLNDNISVTRMKVNTSLSEHLKPRKIKSPYCINDFTIDEDFICGIDECDKKLIKINNVNDGYAEGVMTMIYDDEDEEQIENVTLISPFAYMWVNNTYDEFYIEERLLSEILKEKVLPDYVRKFVLENSCFKENERLFNKYEVPALNESPDCCATTTYHF